MANVGLVLLGAVLFLAGGYLFGTAAVNLTCANTSQISTLSNGQLVVNQVCMSGSSSSSTSSSSASTSTTTTATNPLTLTLLGGNAFVNGLPVSWTASGATPYGQVQVQTGCGNTLITLTPNSVADQTGFVAGTFTVTNQYGYLCTLYVTDISTGHGAQASYQVLPTLSTLPAGTSNTDGQLAQLGGGFVLIVAGLAIASVGARRRR